MKKRRIIPRSGLRKKLTALNRKIKTRALDEQQKNLYKIVSGNFEISNQQIVELEKEINELSQSREHTVNVLEDKVARVEENLGSIESRVQETYYCQLVPAFIEDKLIEFEDQLTVNNLRIDGIRIKTKRNMERL